MPIELLQTFAFLFSILISLALAASVMQVIIKSIKVERDERPPAVFLPHSPMEHEPEPLHWRLMRRQSTDELLRKARRARARAGMTQEEIHLLQRLQSESEGRRRAR